MAIPTLFCPLGPCNRPTGQHAARAPASPRTNQALHGPRGQDDDNVLQELSYPERRLGLYTDLYQHRAAIESIVSFHMNLSNEQTCSVGEVKEWISGSFNVCIPVYIDGGDNTVPRNVLIRFLLPFKVGETQRPDNANEKLRSETATFIWVRQRIPPPSPYLSHNCPFDQITGYLIMDYIVSTDTAMLSEFWGKLRLDQKRRTNLFRGLSRIILSLAQHPFDRIGSLKIDNDGSIKHTNRPLTLRLHHLENESVPTNIDRDLTFPTSDDYFMDLLSYHDSRLRHAPNLIQNNADGEAQLSTLTIMRALLPHFFYRELRRGPFVLTWTDLHQSNLFVDSDWNIKSLVDLEWTCSLPVEIIHPPYWLTNYTVDQLYLEKYLDAFSEAYSEFINILKKKKKICI